MVYCNKCGCENIKYFGIRGNEYYCRKCITFKGEQAINKTTTKIAKVKLKLDYLLTKEQEDISNKVCASIENKKNILIYAVCGAGKTEIVYKTIEKALKNNKKVGFAIPRKDVVIELEDRIKDAFPLNSVVSVYGGHTEKLDGDIILLTTHQLFRYENYFDLLIIDETDAFPFSKNEVLLKHFDSSIKGNYIMMSATPLKWMIDKITKERGVILSLLKRFHGHKIVEPILSVIPFLQEIKVIGLLKKYQKENKQCLIFVPTRIESERLFNLLKLFFKNIDYVHSLKENRNNIINDFKKKDKQFLITTSILERGITIKNVQAIIFDASHEIYDTATLIQMAGRVGRKMNAYEGEVHFLAKKPTIFIEEAIMKIKEANQNALL